MKLVDVEYTFDNNKNPVYSLPTAGWISRAWSKTWRRCLRTRIELRQIGVRDEAKMLGGLGICGGRSAVQHAI